MDKEIEAVRGIFRELNKKELIKGFLLDNEGVRFQANDGTMVLLKVVPLEQNKDK